MKLWDRRNMGGWDEGFVLVARLSDEARLECADETEFYSPSSSLSSSTPSLPQASCTRLPVT